MVFKDAVRLPNSAQILRPRRVALLPPVRAAPRARGGPRARARKRCVSRWIEAPDGCGLLRKAFVPLACKARGGGGRWDGSGKHRRNQCAPHRDPWGRASKSKRLQPRTSNACSLAVQESDIPHGPAIFAKHGIALLSTCKDCFPHVMSHSFRGARKRNRNRESARRRTAPGQKWSPRPEMRARVTQFTFESGEPDILGSRNTLEVSREWGIADC